MATRHQRHTLPLFELSLILFHLYKDSNNIAEIKPYRNQLEKQRIDELEKILNFVTEICKTLETLKMDVLKSLNKKIDIPSLREKMLTMEEKIYRTKDTIRQELVKALGDQETLTKDLKHLEKRMEDWVKPSFGPHVLKPMKPTSSYKMSNIQSSNPTNEFQKFVRDSGGHYGGWLEHDHLLFIRERKKNRAKEKFFSSVLSYLPDLSYDEIENHENWYVKYESLKAAHKEAIQKWKEKKAMQDQEFKLQKDKTVEKKEGKTHNKKTTYQVDIAERIKEWKKKQMEKKLEEIERRAQEKKELQREREKLNKINRLKKLAVDRYKSEKLKIQTELVQQQNEKKTSAEDKIKKNILLKSFRLQDIKFIEKKKEIRLQLESKSSKKIEYLKLARCPFDFLLQRDPQRIFKPTLIWTQHCQPNDCNERLNVFNLNTIPKLAIPEWRRSLQFN